MFMRKLPLACALLIAVAMAQAEDVVTSFSEPATADDIDLVFLSILPDGENLPAGSGTAEQGKPIYDLYCAACHGFDGEGTLANMLVGGRGTLGSDAPVKTLGSYWPYATTVFNYIRRSMPYTAPMSLTNADYYAITAFLLNKNDIIAADLVIDKDSLAGVRMPNRDGFVNAYPDIPSQYDHMK
jgi:cytochrome c